ncbi:hypothetical protein ACFQMJ_18080 [Cohnella cellulosilytica]|uniref:Uncharacterized protein n=2 Tax=Cohnella cellulosilytica TaxID=986710 RepID=A0ABW2FB04_9BACL
MVAIYWVASGHRCSARRLAGTLKLQYRTARWLLNKIRAAMYSNESAPLFDFWNREKRTAQQPIVRKAMQMMYRRARSFVRKYYGRVAKWRRPYYYCEYRFRCSNEHNPVEALVKLATSACTTIYTMNEYGSLRSTSRRRLDDEAA